MYIVKEQVFTLQIDVECLLLCFYPFLSELSSGMILNTANKFCFVEMTD